MEVRIVGRAPLEATVYELDKWRCNLCGKVFTAPLPEEAGKEKYDETAGAMVALLKYGGGLPFHRLEKLQDSLGVPLPASTQWEIVERTADQIHPVYRELIRQAAQGEIFHNDDTTMKILANLQNNDPQDPNLAQREFHHRGPGRTGRTPHGPLLYRPQARRGESGPTPGTKGLGS